MEQKQTIRNLNTALQMEITALISISCTRRFWTTGGCRAWPR